MTQLWQRAHQLCLVVSENEKLVVFLMKKKSLGLLGKPPKAYVGWWGYRLVGSQLFMEVSSEQSWSHLSAEPSQHLQPKGHQQKQSVWEQVPAESVTTAAAALNRFFQENQYQENQLP